MRKLKKAVATLLVLTIATSILMALSVTQAQVPSTMESFPFIEAVPNPVGVGQQVTIRFGILQALANVYEGWANVTVTVVDPKGVTKTLGPFKTDSTGGTYTDFFPDQVGTYKLTTNFPQQPIPSTQYDFERGVLIPAGTIFKASTSETLDLVVQQEPLPTYPTAPLPTYYWSRPIDPQLQSWYSISGNWMTRPDNDVALYNDYAPETAHVLWAKPLTTGGLTGGLWGTDQLPVSSETGDAYEGKWVNSVILNGILYYNVAGNPMGGATETNGIMAVDLHTGKELWFRNNTFLSFGQALWFYGFNYAGVFTYLWDTSGPEWKAYDPFTGEWQWSLINVPSGTRVFGPNGEILIYVTDYANGWMALWNSTACGQQNAFGGYALGADLGSWGRIVGKQIMNGSNPRSYSWNVTIPKGLTVGASFGAPVLKVYPDRVVGCDFNQTRVRVWAVSTAPETRGQLIFDKTWNAPAEWLSGFVTLHYAGATDEVKDGVIAVWVKEYRKFYGFSVEDGRYLWNTDSEYWSDAYGWGNAEHTWYFAYGKLYSVGVGGIVYAYDLKTGKTSWTYNMTDPYHETVTGPNWWGWIAVIANGKIYVTTTEHSVNMPMPRGGPYVCLNATDGTEIWRVNGMFRGTRWGGNSVMGDSIIATMDTYDQQIYAIGKGPTKVTVAAGPKSSVQGTSVVIEGTITDISPGTASDSMTLRFPNGVPAVSDASQSEWMLYVYKQFPRPANASGVEIVLSVLDSNNNFREIGRTTSDLEGYYSFQWKPDIPGKFTVYASFAGSKAYYGSLAETSFVVDEAPTPTAAPTPAPASMADLYFVPMSIGMIVAIIVAAVVIVLMLRKR
ncbi:MAG: PQQ-binding-like beta-propeller repeat protein [Candidatus Bathyarchaeota archaeon]|nr:PQQ-binding-like beta-propeller repeat protein [Candidatus Bathyarchaeota archaeon]